MESRGLCDVLLVGGRVIDPESGLDAVRAVGVRDGTIVHVGVDTVPAARVVDVSGMVVSPGFIDLHSHAQTINGLRLQALDGVTTSFELEGGALPVADHYAWAERVGRPINFGYSAGWVYARMSVLDGVVPARPQDDESARIAINTFEDNQDGPRWRGEADAREIQRIIDTVRAQIDDGAVGIGMLAGYAPGHSSAELDALASLAAEVNQPLFVHSRSMAATDHGGSLDAVRELTSASERFGAHIHLCHMNSTSGLRVASIVEEIKRAQAAGARVTTEAYPYDAGSTVIGAAFLAPERLAESNLTPSSITYLRTGERVADTARLREIRASDPGGTCILQTFDLDDREQRALLLKALTFPGAAIASDAMVMTSSDETRRNPDAVAAITGDVWPLPDGLIAHPRSAGCFSKALSWLVRETGALDLSDAIGRCTVIPADILAEAAPAMRSKGRLQVGADADLCVFDPETIAPGGDYRHLRPSIGVQHLFVRGVPVVADAALLAHALPGRPILGSRAS